MVKQNFQSLEHLASIGRLSDNYIQECHELICKKVLKRFIGYFYEAQKTYSSDPEWQLISYLRCGQLVTIMRKKKDYESFADKEPLKTFFASFDRIVALRNGVDELYSISWPGSADHDNDTRTESPPEIDIELIVLSMLQITPKQLLSLTKMPFGYSAVILDIRTDKFYGDIIVPNEFNVTIIPISTDKLQAGMTFTELQHILPLGQQEFLPRVFTSDYVVVLADKDPVLIGGKFKQQSHAGIISAALNDLSTEKLKKDMQFLLGGFEKWKKEFPCFVKWKMLDFDNILENFKYEGVVTPEYLSRDLDKRLPQISIADVKKNEKLADYKKRLNKILKKITEEKMKEKTKLGETCEVDAKLQNELSSVKEENDTLKKELNEAKRKVDMLNRLTLCLTTDKDNLKVYKQIVDKMCSNLFCSVCLQISFKYRVCTSGKHIASCLNCAPRLGGSCPICRQQTNAPNEAIFEEAAAFLADNNFEISKERDVIKIRSNQGNVEDIYEVPLSLNSESLLITQALSELLHSPGSLINLDFEENLV